MLTKKKTLTATPLTGLQITNLVTYSSPELDALPDATLDMTPTVTPTVVPIGNPTECLEVTHSTTRAAARPFPLNLHLNITDRSPTYLPHFDSYCISSSTEACDAICDASCDASCDAPCDTSPLNVPITEALVLSRGGK